MADYKKAQFEAEKIWAEMFLEELPLPILEVAESYGLTIREANFSRRPDLSGILDVEKQTVYLNRSDSPEHKRFTIAHELGHWILHRTMLTKGSELTIYYRRPLGCERDEREKEANCFAANLLVPLRQLKKYQGRYSNQVIAEIFAVSQQVVGYMLHALKGDAHDQ